MTLRESQSKGRLRLRHLNEVTEAKSEEMDAQRARFARLARKESKPKVFTAYNLFPTPPHIADRLVELADIRWGHKVLEPSAGTGNILQAILRRHGSVVDDIAIQDKHIHVTAVEIDGPLWHYLSQSEFSMWVTARLGDFLQYDGSDGPFDRIVMNPPFNMRADIRHTLKAMSLLKPQGRLVSIVMDGHQRREKLGSLGQWIELPSGSFKSEKTGVQTAIVVIDK